MKRIDDLIKRYKELEVIKDDLEKVFKLFVQTYKNNHLVLVVGNGGSAADSNHIVGELMKSFCRKRKIPDSLIKKIKKNKKYGEELCNNLQGALPTISLNNHESLNTAFLNDVDPLVTFAQQVLGYGNKGDLFFGISTSGNSKNVVMAAITAKAKGMKVVALTGQNDSDLSQIADITIKAPALETYKIQEYHLPIYHCLCLMLEDYFWPDEF